jgi:hypothetical protein
MSNKPRFLRLLSKRASTVRYRRVDSVIPCPCRTPEGFRDPEWHIANPLEPICNEAGFLPDPANTVDVTVKGFVQPIQSTRATRLATELGLIPPGEIQMDDHLAILPCEWDGVSLNFRDWGRSGEDFIEYAGQRFTIVNSNLIPDPDNGDPFHHWECGLRLITDKPVT